MRRGGRGRDGGGGGRGGGRGGKGAKPHFTRVIPKFLQQYESMLTGGPRADAGIEEEVFSGGGEPTDGARASNGTNTGNSVSGLPGVDRSNAQHQARQAGGASSGGAFEDYDEEEVAALEAYMKTHPSKEEDREALRKRAKELSARIGAGPKGQGATDEGTTATNSPGPEAGATAKGNDRESPPEEPLEYTDASGRLKFNKRSVGPSADTGRADSARDKKKTKRTKLAKLSNKKLLSFGDDEDG